MALAAHRARAPILPHNQTTVMAAGAFSGQGSDGSKVIVIALATKKPPMCWAAISGGVPGLVWFTSWAKT